MGHLRGPQVTGWEIRTGAGEGLTAGGLLRISLNLGRVLGRSGLPVLGLVGVAVALGRLGRVDGLALELDVGDEAQLGVGVVGHRLDAAVGKVHGVGTFRERIELRLEEL